MMLQEHADINTVRVSPVLIDSQQCPLTAVENERGVDCVLVTPEGNPQESPSLVVSANIM